MLTLNGYDLYRHKLTYIKYPALPAALTSHLLCLYSTGPAGMSMTAAL